jgi:hypothetical protein
MAVSLIASRAPRGLALSRRGFIVSCVNLTTAVGLTARGSPSTETQQHLCGLCHGNGSASRFAP